MACFPRWLLIAVLSTPSSSSDIRAAETVHWRDAMVCSRNLFLFFGTHQACGISLALPSAAICEHPIKPHLLFSHACPESSPWLGEQSTEISARHLNDQPEKTPCSAINNIFLSVKRSAVLGERHSTMNTDNLFSPELFC